MKPSLIKKIDKKRSPDDEVDTGYESDVDTSPLLGHKILSIFAKAARRAKFNEAQKAEEDSVEPRKMHFKN